FPDMYAFTLRVISCLCIFQGGVFSEECSYGVFGKRETFLVPAGGSLSLFCVVQHCGGNWTGNWKRQNLTTSTTVENSARHRFTIGPVSANQSKLHLKILSVRESDEGFYTWNVKWSDGSHDVSHWMQVNVTKGVAFERKPLHRVLVCTGAFLCLPVILGLARCLSSEVKQQPHPRIESVCGVFDLVEVSHSFISSYMLQLLYADISQDALRNQKAQREPVEPTVYSTVRFF
uniref:Ig-like domain-containing protein n=1 Tax=Xiphophorus couchianus TaxID=32473 RepID=A0A3B5KUJ8_9TELE